jgi:hypothetical protein
MPVLRAPVAPEAVTSGEDRFRCPKLHAVLTAAECRRRYDLAHEVVDGKLDAKKVARRTAINVASFCRGCALGPDVIHPKVKP